MKVKSILAFGAAVLFGSASVHAITNVGVVLSLVADVSSSIDTPEYQFQIQGFANAFKDPDVQNRIENTPGGIAVNFIEFAGRRERVNNVPQDVPPNERIGFTHLQTAADAQAFGELIASFFDATDDGPNNDDVLGGGRSPSLGPFTHIKGAIDFAANIIKNSEYIGKRTIIDISGDGRDNYAVNPATTPNETEQDFADGGALVKAAGDAALLMGVSAINGLPIVTGDQDAPAQDLQNYYNTYVRNGAGSFIIPANGFEDFDAAIKSKIEREIIITVPDTGATFALTGFGLLALLTFRRWRNR